MESLIFFDTYLSGTATTTDPAGDYRGPGYQTFVETSGGVAIYEVEVVVEPATTEQVVDSVVGVATATEVTITEQVETTEDVTIQVPIDIQVEQTTTATRTADAP